MIDNGPTTHRYVCVLNKKVNIGRALNALGHLSVGLTALIKSEKGLRCQTYVDADKGVHNSISDNPFIVLKAKNSNKLRELRSLLIQADVPFTDFTNTMIEGTYLDQLKQTSETSEKDLEYFGICFFTTHKEAKLLTKKFSLYT